MNKIPQGVYNLYKPLSLKDSIYLKLRWRLCLFSLIESLVPKEGLVFDIGCGYGMLSNLMAVNSSKREVIGIDLNKSRISVAKKTEKNRNVKFLIKDVNKLQLRKCKAVVMSDFLHHIDYNAQEAILKQIYEKLLSNGSLIVQDIKKRPFWKYLFASSLDRILNPKDQLFYRSQESFYRMLSGIGFEVKVVDAHKGLPLPDVIYVCTKK